MIAVLSELLMTCDEWREIPAYKALTQDLLNAGRL